MTVVILTTESFDAANVDPATVTLGDEVGSDTAVARRNNGRLYASLQDVDGDGDRDLVLHFSIPELVASSDLTASTTQLVLLGDLFSGVQIRGSDDVRVVP